jgi:predicted TIM-barrel fold metal-dependent hydrolase
MDGAGVRNAIVVHPEPYQDDHRYLRHCLEVGEGRLKGTCLVFADQPNSIAKLRELARQLPLIAARVHAYAPDRLPPFGKPELRRLWARATDLGLAIQLHFEPRYAPGFEPLIKEFAQTRVIIDHLGRPFQGTPEQHETVIRWAQYPNTIMKLSAIPERRQYPHRDIGPIVRRLVKEFGADRLICGGGFGANATSGSYQEAFEWTRGFIDHLSLEDQSKVIGGNAISLFDL